MKCKWYIKVLLYICVALIMILYGYPLLYVLSSSLKSQQEFWMDPIGLVQNIRLQNFVEAWEMAGLGSKIFNSLFYTITCTTLSVTMAVFLSYPIARRYHKLCGAIYTAFMIGMFIPDPTIPRWQMIFQAGLYDTRLGYILTLVGGGGVTLLMFVSYIKSLPRELDEAAIVDGCRYVPFVVQILLPLMKPAIVSMVVLQSISVWNDILNAVLYLSDEKLFPITRGLYVFKGVYSNNVPLLSAALVIIAIPMVIMYILLQKHIIDGITVGGVKA